MRPSGNPLSKSDYKAFVGGDVKITDIEMVKVNKVDVGADMAFATASESAGAGT